MKMDGFYNAVQASLVIFLLMAVGYVLGRLGWITQKEKGFISRYCVNVAVPCNCLVGLLNNLTRDALLEGVWMMLAVLVSVTVSIFASILLANLLRLPRERWGVFVSMAAFSNTLFIGVPVCHQLFGDAGTPYVMIYYMGHNALFQFVAVPLVERAGTVTGKKLTVGEKLKDFFCKPPIAGTIFAIVLLLLNLRPPNVIMSAAGYISNSVTPMALIYCGYIMFELGLKNIRLMKGLPALLVYRLGVAPVLCLVFCKLFGMGGLPMSVFIVESALPVVSQVTVMAGAYGADEKYSATGASLTTLGSFITIPILMLLLG